MEEIMEYSGTARLFDVHAHYTDPRFAAEYPGGADALLARIMPEPAGYIINVATNPDNAKEVIGQAGRYPGMYAAVGIHPGDLRPDMSLEAELEKLRQLLERAREHKIVAIGEIGLDYYWRPGDRELQLSFFEAQMELAAEYSLPVQVHNRQAHGDCLRVVRRHPGVRGVFHSFSGSPEMAAELVERGWYISFSGVLTFKNARRVPKVARSILTDRILLESDCPYLAPHPHRGRLNHSGLMVHTAEELGRLIGLETEGAIRKTAGNAARLFGISLV
ncbi:MAG TPA: TatD family hydrolase [Clostridiales bacterium]|jgi:TatD DNase family protein|nr:TatD family hydrolase [Clostridiales bacterium]